MAPFPAPRFRARLLRDEGFLLVEVLVSALVLVAASAVVMVAIQRSDQLAGNQQKRSVAANVAQAELERVRSLPIEDVANLRAGTSGRSTQKLNGVTYTIDTASKWLSDGQDTVDCTASNGGLDYLQATTTVSWKSAPDAPPVKPVKLSTLIAPTNRAGRSDHGSLAVQIVGPDGVTGVEGIPVTLSGPGNFSDQTDPSGCVVWGDLDATHGPWTLAFTKAGYVDVDGNEQVTSPVTVVGGSTTKKVFLYSEAGMANIMFRTNSSAGLVPTTQGGVVFENSQMSGPRIFKFASFTDTWKDGTKFFPFQSGPYYVYPGRCTSVRPTSGGTNFNATANVTQGAFVYAPALDIRLQTSSGVPLPIASVTYTDDCNEQTVRTGGDPGRTGYLLPGDQGFPYSARATVCVKATNGQRAIRTSVPNTNFAAPTSLTMTTSGGGSC